MKVVERLKDIAEMRDSGGKVVARKGSTCDLIRDGKILLVKKQWHDGDWVFDGEYEYRIEKHVYEKDVW